jgi:hypothetical protein
MLIINGHQFPAAEVKSAKRSLISLRNMFMSSSIFQLICVLTDKDFNKKMLSFGPKMIERRSNEGVMKVSGLENWHFFGRADMTGRPFAAEEHRDDLCNPFWDKSKKQAMLPEQVFQMSGDLLAIEPVGVTFFLVKDAVCHEEDVNRGRVNFFL